MFHTLFYEPVYNLIAFTLTVVPLHDIGATIIIVTLIVKLLLLPFNVSALRTQYLMKKIEPELNKIKELQKKDPQEASKKMIELYRSEKINPLSGLFAMILQIPVFFALYFVFSKGLHTDPNSLYSFITFPETLHTKAFGLFDVTQKNLVIAVLAGFASFLLARRQTEYMGSSDHSKGGDSFQDHFMKSMKIQVTYVIPIIVAISGSVLPSALSLYWLVSSSVSYVLDIYVKNKLAHLKPL